jgi:hypothetical protein
MEINEEHPMEVRNSSEVAEKRRPVSFASGRQSQINQTTEDVIAP